MKAEIIESPESGRCCRLCCSGLNHSFSFSFYGDLSKHRPCAVARELFFLQQHVNAAERWWMVKNNTLCLLFPHLSGFLLTLYLTLLYKHTPANRGVMKVLEAWHEVLGTVWNSVNVDRFLSGIYTAVKKNRAIHSNWCNMYHTFHLGKQLSKLHAGWGPYFHLWF